mmetsp:Transcript_7413/g.15768  ORF Transcript_7413/g.15768 Transcript_7413/m.15768 type:complete len:132 (-) Transcript_7413:1174-1569(-)
MYSRSAIQRVCFVPVFPTPPPAALSMLNILCIHFIDSGSTLCYYHIFFTSNSLRFNNECNACLHRNYAAPQSFRNAFHSRHPQYVQLSVELILLHKEQDSGPAISQGIVFAFIRPLLLRGHGADYGLLVRE